MVQTYNGPHFGFAVKNYYAEFLAALQVHEYEDKYFPGIQYEAPIVPAPLPARSALLLQVSAPTRHRTATTHHASKHWSHAAPKHRHHSTQAT